MIQRRGFEGQAWAWAIPEMTANASAPMTPLLNIPATYVAIPASKFREPTPSCVAALAVIRLHPVFKHLALCAKALEQFGILLGLFTINQFRHLPLEVLATNLLA